MRHIQVNCSVRTTDGANAMMQPAGAEAGLAHKKPGSHLEYEIACGYKHVGEGYLETLVSKIQLSRE